MASDSFVVEERIESISYVGSYDDDECRRAVLRLMTDSEVTVCEETGKYLVQRNDVKSAELLFMGIAVSFEHQRAWTLWMISNAWTAELFDLEEITNEILRDSNFLARVGAHDVLRWIGLESSK